MRAALEFSSFVAVATALHLGLWAGLPAGGGQSAGAGGEALVSLEAAPGALQALADAWRQPPEAQAQVSPPLPEAPARATEPALPRATDPTPRQAAPRAVPGPQSKPSAPPPPVPSPAPKIADSAPRFAVAPEAASAPGDPTFAPPETAPAAVVPPAALPAPSPETAPPRPEPAPQKSPPAEPEAHPDTPAAPPPVPAQKAAGSGGRQAAGNRGAAEVSTGNPALRQSLMARWQGAIGAAIERRKRYPRGSRGSGRVVLTLTITRQGQLAAVAVTRSSGQPLLDEAALSAVRRARLPAAPRGLDEPRYSFRLPLSFAP